MLLTNQYIHNKSIMVAILGAPNAGKSSLINYLLGFDLSIVTPKAQTTRNRFHCTFTVDHTEIVMVDTPGLHASNQEINKRMNQEAKEGITGADLNLLLIDLSRDLLEQFKNFCDHMGATDQLQKTWVVFTKSDLVPNWQQMPLEKVVAHMKERVPAIERHFVVSSQSGEDMHALTGALCDAAQPGPHLYPGGEVSNKSERFFASEYIREQAFHMLQEEVPYEMAVTIDEFKAPRAKAKDSAEFEPKKDELKKGDEEKKKPFTYISASILVNRPSQRAIVIGKGGQVIKQIGTKARQKIEAMLGSPVHLNLHVKVVPKWYKNNKILEELELHRAPDSNRVWRKRS